MSNTEKNQNLITADKIYNILINNAIIEEGTIINLETAKNSPIEQRRQEVINNNKLQYYYELHESYRRFLTILFEIENFISIVLSSDEPAFKLAEDRLGRVVLEKNKPISQFFSYKNFLLTAFTTDFLTYFIPRLNFSEHVKLFIRCGNDLGIINGDMHHSNSKETYKIYNDFLDAIRIEAKSAGFKKNVARREEQSLKRERSVSKYIDDLFSTYSPLLVLKLDLYFDPKYANDISVDDAKKAFQKFKNNWRGKPTLFNFQVGYVFKADWAPCKGTHFDLILFFSNPDEIDDTILAEHIGDYWQNVITKDKGTYRNCGKNSFRFKKSSIVGIINRDNDSARNTLAEYVIGFLTKSDKYLTAEVLKKGKSFGHGEVKRT